MIFPLLERHVATAIAVARFLEYSGKSRARCPSRYESYRYLETSTLPYMVVLGQVSIQRVCMECTHPSLRCILLCSVATFEPHALTPESHPVHSSVREVCTPAVPENSASLITIIEACNWLSLEVRNQLAVILRNSRKR